MIYTRFFFFPNLTEFQKHYWWFCFKWTTAKKLSYNLSFYASWGMHMKCCTPRKDMRRNLWKPRRNMF